MLLASSITADSSYNFKLGIIFKSGKLNFAHIILNQQGNYGQRHNFGALSILLLVEF
jgi:hypothetical protein